MPRDDPCDGFARSTATSPRACSRASTRASMLRSTRSRNASMTCGSSSRSSSRRARSAASSSSRDSSGLAIPRVIPLGSRRRKGTVAAVSQRDRLVGRHPGELPLQSAAVWHGARPRLLWVRRADVAAAFGRYGRSRTRTWYLFLISLPRRGGWRSRLVRPDATGVEPNSAGGCRRGGAGRSPRCVCHWCAIRWRGDAARPRGPGPRNPAHQRSGRRPSRSSPSGPGEARREAIALTGAERGATPSSARQLVDVARGALLVLVALVVLAGERGERSEPRAAGRRPKAALEVVKNSAHRASPRLGLVSAVGATAYGAVLQFEKPLAAEIRSVPFPAGFSPLTKVSTPGD